MTFLFMCQLRCADLLNVKIFKVSLFKTVALMDSFKLSAEQIESFCFINDLYMHLSKMLISRFRESPFLFAEITNCFLLLV